MKHLGKIIVGAILVVGLIAFMIVDAHQFYRADAGVHRFTYIWNSNVKYKKQKMYNKVAYADKEDLIHGNNQRAQEADQKAQENGQNIPYPKSKDGNYWSWFNNHSSMSKSGSTDTFMDSLLGGHEPKYYMLKDNRKILSQHGVHGSANF